MKASDYRKLASAKRAEAPIFDVSLPSGAVWQLREPPIQQWVLSGKLPASLTAKMAAAANQNNSEDAQKAIVAQLTPEDLINNLAFGRDLLLYCAVNPRIVPNANPENEDEIAPEEILPDDFSFLINWVMVGGDPSSRLDTFRPE